MKKALYKILIIIGIIGILIYFNPKNEDFNKYIYDEKINSKMTYEEAKLLGLNKIIEIGYERKDYMIFSTYETNKNLDNNKNYKYIGILKMFIEI